jgi:DNA helicase-2/ATP-dependent DNA helicase PcrA
MQNELEGVDKRIFELLNLDNPKSFLLFAGAGAGKTRTLVNTLLALKYHRNDQLVNARQRIAVITYTNAACEEIKHRLSFDSSFDISTIHSFAWSLIKPFTQDIKNWLLIRLQEKIDELTEKLQKARDPSNKTAIQNKAKLEKSVTRLSDLNEITEFAYSSVELLSGKGALNHAEVIGLAASMLMEKPLLQKILIKKYPILLIDESQDTAKSLLESLIEVQKTNSEHFSLGIIGDEMQSIYSGGMRNVKANLPDDWFILEKLVNYRSPKRIIDLINAIRKDADAWQQQYFIEDKGVVRLFIANSTTHNKKKFEAQVKEEMQSISGDQLWGAKFFIDEFDVQHESVKCLTLEHAMAAIRGVFADFYIPLSKNEKLRDAAINGTRREFSYFINVVAPFCNAVKTNDEFSIMNILKEHSNLISHQNIEFAKDPRKTLSKTKEVVTELKALLLSETTSIYDVLYLITENKLFLLPEDLAPSMTIIGLGLDASEEKKKETISGAWDKALAAPYSQLENYVSYISGSLGFATHQGVKGLEFDRVMAILDDEEANGFLFSYEKLFGAEPKSNTDLTNEENNKDTAISRTRRLFYVICSRARKSLAVVAYTKAPEALKKKALDSWFEVEEVIIL